VNLPLNILDLGSFDALVVNDKNHGRQAKLMMAYTEKEAGGFAGVLSNWRAGAFAGDGIEVVGAIFQEKDEKKEKKDKIKL
jgi:hypothetical protein